jgi:Domain of unknown function (DUF4347)
MLSPSPLSGNSAAIPLATTPLATAPLAAPLTLQPSPALSASPAAATRSAAATVVPTPPPILPLPVGSRQEIAFVDRQVANYQQLVSGIRARIDVVFLDPLVDGVQQITQELSKRKGLAAVHVISNGAIGRIQLGKSELSMQTLPGYRDELASWTASLLPGADLIFYGSQIGATLPSPPKPIPVSPAPINPAPPNSNPANPILATPVPLPTPELLAAIRQITKADVAASNDVTGFDRTVTDPSKQGDWVLEVNVGEISTQLALRPSVLLTYQSTLTLTTVPIVPIFPAPVVPAPVVLAPVVPAPVVPVPVVPAPVVPAPVVPAPVVPAPVVPAPVPSKPAQT